MMNTRQRLAGLDLLRGVAAFGIVGCHLTLNPKTAAASACLTFCDFNVALFALLAGFLMPTVSDGAGARAYLGGRLRRLILPYFVWTAIYVVATIGFDLVLDGGFDPKFANPHHWVGILLLGNSATHLWFLACLFYGQVLVTVAEGVLAALVRTAAPGVRRLYAAFLFAAGFALIFAVGRRGGFFDWYFLRLFALLVTGHGLRGLVGAEALRRWTAPLGCLTGALALAYFFCGDVAQILRDWALAVSLLLFVWSGDAGAEGSPARGWRRVATVVGAASMGVYLVHPLVTRAGSVLCHRLFAAPFTAPVVLADWFAACAISFLLVRAYCKFTTAWKRRDGIEVPA